MTFPSGFLIIDKPRGATSFSMVALVRRLTGVRRVGHAGTLDPLANGVLPVAVGQATRFIEYMDDIPKTYAARIRFGTATDTYDAEGTVTSTADASAVTEASIQSLLPDLTGNIEQVPPAFSAIKLAGKPLYSYARSGEAPSLRPRSVHVGHLVLTHFVSGSSPEAEMVITCGKGTYVRSLAHDLGQQLGVGAHLTALRRTATGGFDITLAHSPTELEALADRGELDSRLLAIDRAVERRRAAILADGHLADVHAGRDLDLDAAPDSETPRDSEICRAYDTDGSFVAVLVHREGRRWHPAKVLPNP